MKNLLRPLLIICILTFLASLPAQAIVNLIVDTDIGPDCGDVNAIVVLHGLGDRGEVNILATICDTSNPWGAPCLDALNTFYGRPGIPVGTLKDPGLLTDYGSYNRELAMHFPHELKSGSDAPDATKLFRQILAAQPDKGVVIVAIGPLRNLSNLLNSAPDSYSSLVTP
jgi:inosine-uridine nucleoside N-ribohydrolase